MRNKTNDMKNLLELRKILNNSNHIYMMDLIESLDFKYIKELLKKNLSISKLSKIDLNNYMDTCLELNYLMQDVEYGISIDSDTK